MNDTLANALRRAGLVCLGSLCFLAQVKPLLGQPRRPEIFGLIGISRVSGDDGYLGRGVAVGAAATLPVTRRWALDFDVTHHVSRHTHFSPALQYRRGKEDLYGFVAFGAGATLTFGPDEFRGGSYSRTHTSFQWHGKAGMVKALPHRLLVRADFMTNFQPVSLDLSARLGIGWRF
jgi:hypothetical protein